MEEPAFRAPALACDAHFHVFGPLDKYPARDPGLRYKMPFAPLSEYLKLASTLACSARVRPTERLFAR